MAASSSTAAAASHPARIAYLRLLDLYKTYTYLDATNGFLEMDKVAIMPPAARQTRMNASFGVMNHQNNVCREAVRQFQIAQPGIDKDLFDPHELANLREGIRILHSTRDLNPSEQARYLQAIQKQQMVSSSFVAGWPEMKQREDWAGFSAMLDDLLPCVVDQYTVLSRGREGYDNALAHHASDITFDDIVRLDHDVMAWWPQLRARAMDEQQQADRQRGAPMLPKALDEFHSQANTRKTERVLRECLNMVRFDWTRGRTVPGPSFFTVPPSYDTRVVYKRNVTSPFWSLTASMHESGHAAYEQGIPRSLWELPLGNTDCKAFHESQAHWMEACVLRDPLFADVASAVLQEVYGDDPAFASDNLNRLHHYLLPNEAEARAPLVATGLRADMDFIAKILVRSRLEHELFVGDIKVRDLPARLVSLQKQYFGDGFEYTMATAKRDLMESQMWPAGQFGYIPVYAPALAFAVQINEAMTAELGDDTVSESLKTGVLAPMLSWLSDRLWSVGRFHESQRDLVHKAAGKPVTADPLRDLLHRRYNVPVPDDEVLRSRKKKYVASSDAPRRSVAAQGKAVPLEQFEAFDLG